MEREEEFNENVMKLFILRSAYDKALKDLRWHKATRTDNVLKEKA